MAKKIVAYLGDLPTPYPYVDADVVSAGPGMDSLTLHPASCNEYVAIGNEVIVSGVYHSAIAGTMRELLLVVDCRGLQEAPALSFSSQFDMFEGGSAAAVSLVAGEYNVYRIAEYVSGHFSVGREASPSPLSGQTMPAEGAPMNLDTLEDAVRTMWAALGGGFATPST